MTTWHYFVSYTYTHARPDSGVFGFGYVEVTLPAPITNFALIEQARDLIQRDMQASKVIILGFQLLRTDPEAMAP